MRQRIEVEEGILTWKTYQVENKKKWAAKSTVWHVRERRDPLAGSSTPNVLEDQCVWSQLLRQKQEIGKWSGLPVKTLRLGWGLGDGRAWPCEWSWVTWWHGHWRMSWDGELWSATPSAQAQPRCYCCRSMLCPNTNQPTTFYLFSRSYLKSVVAARLKRQKSI